MTKEARIKALIESPHYKTPFKTAEILAKASDDDLAKIEAFVAAEEKAVKDKEAADLKVAEEKKAADLKAAGASEPKQQTEAEFMKTAPASIRSMVERHQAAEAKTRAALVSKLVAAQKAFTQAELEAKPTEELEKLAALASVEMVDYGGLGFPRIASAKPEDDPWSNPPDGYALALKAASEKVN